LLDAEDKYTKEGVLDSHVVCTLEALLTNCQQFPLQRFLNLHEGQLGCKFFVLLREPKVTFLTFLFKLRIKYRYFSLRIVKEQIDESCFEVLLMPLSL
jgi:hypothetical protein